MLISRLHVCPLPARLAVRAMSSQKFGPWTIDTAEIFTETPHSFAFVNLKPVVPGEHLLCTAMAHQPSATRIVTSVRNAGHLLVSPKRVAPRFHELSQDEVADLWCAADAPCTAVYRQCCCI